MNYQDKTTGTLERDRTAGNQLVFADTFDGTDMPCDDEQSRRYEHEGVRGARLPGWEEVNVHKLAKDVGVTEQHLRSALTGRKNCTISLLQKTANALNLTLPILIERIEKAKVLERRRRRLIQRRKQG